MRSTLLGGLAVLLIAGAAAVWAVDWRALEPEQRVAETGQPLTEERLKEAQVFPKEPVKDEARRVGGEGFATVEIEEETIARLPAKPIPPKEPEPERPKLAPVPVSLQRPLIERPGELRSDEIVVRLAGVISPELDQTCDTIDKSRPCGREARTALRNFIRSRTTICILPREPQEETVDAQCTVGGKDVAEWLVRHGWAVAQDGSNYQTIMTKAREDKFGLLREGADAVFLLTGSPERTATGN